ncbi:MAG: hypothetical protein FJ404_16175 [Verrucomicrobia bacterium]|nr:hypothetical protein [Verrucomicrobiota bacterium]
MTLAALTARRANIDDLPALKTLWTQHGIEASEAERQITEFQVAFDERQILAGCAAVRVSGQNALIHSEAYAQPESAGLVRATLWPRVQSLARNLGLFRLWIRSPDEFWKSNGFGDPTEMARKKWPEEWGPQTPPLACLVLREESLELISIEKEFELFQQAQKESTEKVFRQARFAKAFALLVLAVGVAVVVIFLGRTFTRTPVFRSLFRGR